MEETKQSAVEGKGWESDASAGQWEDEAAEKEEESEWMEASPVPALSASRPPLRGYSATAFAVYTPEMRPTPQLSS